MEDKEFDGLVKEALKILREAYGPKNPTHCLESETVIALCEGTISEEGRENTSRHLVDCYSCRASVKFYTDLKDYHKKHKRD